MPITHLMRKASPPILASLLVLLATTRPGVAAADLATTSTFNIGAQPLQRAVVQFTEQSGIQVTSAAELIKNRRTGGVVGEFAGSVALTKLLAGTQLEYRVVDGNTVAIVAQPSAPRSTEADESRASVSAGAPELEADKGGQKRSFWDRFRVAQADQGQTAGNRAVATSDTSSEGDSTSAVEEVVVTAQKRSERIKDVPMSVSVLGGAYLDGATSGGTTEALNLVPGVATTVIQQGGGTQVTVRGVSSGLALLNGPSPIAYYLDSAPFGLVKNAIAPDTNAYDLERIEVLRGPQGTLYGASALNGVVRILTKDANLDELEFKVRSSISATEDGSENYRGDAAINIPIVEGLLAVRGVIGYEGSSGWIDRPAVNRSDANDSRVRNARLHVNAQPTDRLSLGLSGWFSRSDYDEAPLGRDDHRSLAPIDEPMLTDYEVYSGDVDYQFDGFTLSSATSLLNYENESVLNTAGNQLFTGLDSRVLTEEIVINSLDEGEWRWSIGGIYRDVEDHRITRFVALPAPLDFTDESDSYAVFGEATRLFRDGKFAVTLGARYFHDEQTSSENVRHTGNPAQPLYRASDTFEATTPRLVLTWHASQDLTVYTSYAQGFRSGFNQDAQVAALGGGQFPNADPDTLTNYELGAKGDLWGNRISFDAAVFYVDWEDVQQSLAVPFLGSFITAPINAGEASGWGADFAVSASLIDGLDVGLSVGWNDLALDSDVRSAGVILFGAGDRLNYSPEYNAGVSADYTFALGSGGFEGRLSASANHTSERSYRTVAGGVRTIWEGDSLFYTRASFSIDAPQNWSATLFVDNANDEDGVPIRNIFNNPDRTVRVRPRTIGMQVEYHFN